MSYYQITVLEGQTVFDLAIQEYGGVDGLPLLFTDNPSLEDMNTDPVPGSILLIRTQPVVDSPDVMNHFRINKIKPCSTSIA